MITTNGFGCDHFVMKRCFLNVRNGIIRVYISWFPAKEKLNQE